MKTLYTIFRSTAFALACALLGVGLVTQGLLWYRRDMLFTRAAAAATAAGVLLFLLALVWWAALSIRRRGGHPAFTCAGLLLGGAGVLAAFALLFTGRLLPPSFAPDTLGELADHALGGRPASLQDAAAFASRNVSTIYADDCQGQAWEFLSALPLDTRHAPSLTGGGLCRGTKVWATLQGSQGGSLQILVLFWNDTRVAVATGAPGSLDDAARWAKFPEDLQDYGAQVYGFAEPVDMDALQSIAKAHQSSTGRPLLSGEVSVADIASTGPQPTIRRIQGSLIVAGALLVLSLIGTPLYKRCRNRQIRRTGYDAGRWPEVLLSGAILLGLAAGITWLPAWYIAWYLFLLLILLRGRGLDAGPALLLSLLQPLGLLDDLLHGHIFMLYQLAPAVKGRYGARMDVTPLGMDTKTVGSQFRKDDPRTSHVEDAFLREQLKQEHDQSQQKNPPQP